MDQDIIFKRILDAAAATLEGLPEVYGRVYAELDVSLDPDQLPAINLTAGDDVTTLIDPDTYEVRMELQLHILVDSAQGLAQLSAIEQAAHLRLAGNPQLDDLLAGALRRTQGTRRLLRNTEGTPAHRQVTYECKCYVGTDLASMP